MTSEIQQQMSDAFNNYIDLAYVLVEDLDKLTENEENSASWRRNYVRIATSLIEGYGHCFRELSAVALKLEHPPISKLEENAIKSGFGLTSPERAKLTLSATYKLFDISSLPNFEDYEWDKAMEIFEKGNQIMHPKTCDDLEISDESFSKLRESANWLIKHHFQVFKYFYEKHKPTRS